MVMGMGIGFTNPMGMCMGMGMIFENGYGCGYNSTRPMPIPMHHIYVCMDSLAYIKQTHGRGRVVIMQGTPIH